MRQCQHQESGTKSRPIKHALAGVALAACGLVLTAGCSRQYSYAVDVRPILANNCLQCHQPGGIGYQRSGLDMRTYDSLMKGTKYGRVIIPGNSYDSVLVQLIEHRADPTINMPFHKTGITQGEIQKVKTWVDQGAKR
jgi:Planctomycete cytochrome C